MAKRDVTQMAKHELTFVIDTETTDLEFVEACIKERDKRTNDFIQKTLATRTLAGGK